MMVKKLNAILKKFSINCPQDCAKIGCAKCRIEQLAAHFAANDVFVPPCEKVWFIYDRGTRWASIMSKSIYLLRLYELKDLKKFGYYTTKEAAEQALKGGVK
jgi:hypothetical protein